MSTRADSPWKSAGRVWADLESDRGVHAMAISTVPNSKLIQEPALPEDLVAVLARLSDADSVSLFLEDLLTPSEIAAVGERWAIVKHLSAGESQRTVRDALGVSVATVTRGSKQLQYGTGGFAQGFDLLPELGFSDPRGTQS